MLISLFLFSFFFVFLFFLFFLVMEVGYDMTLLCIQLVLFRLLSDVRGHLNDWLPCDFAPRVMRCDAKEAASATANPAVTNKG